jgi:hypothetical protein
MSNHFDARLERALVWFGRQTLYIGEMKYYGEARRRAGTPYQYKVAKFTLAKGRTCIEWPFGLTPDVHICKHVAELLKVDVESMVFREANGFEHTFNTIKSS